MLFRSLSAKCYGDIEEIRRDEINISVEKIQDGGKDVIKSSKSIVKFTPEPREFQVLSMNIVRPKDKDANTTMLLNIAFKIGYKTQEMQVFTSLTPEPVIQKNETTPPIKKNQEPVEVPKPIQPATLTAGSFDVNETQRTMTENSTHTKWKIWPENPTSYITYITSNNDPGYALPSFNELKEFFDKIAYQERNGNSFFSKLFSFKGKETAVFATSEKGEEQQIRCLRVNKQTFQIQEEVKEEGETVNIITLTRRY